ncbi:MAG: redoxin domain-containing protein [Saprospiraceae bacterium]|nr:redoxin domain-containing protein [Saprospiraceae bacterium]
MKFSLYFYFVTFSIFACKQSVPKVGEAPPEFSKMTWLQSQDLQWKDLKNNVVLLRWWTDGCIFCVQSADALNGWHRQYRDSGLVVIGLYHPKPEPRQCDPEEIREYVAEKHFQFPVAIDQDWTHLKKYWLNNGPREFTSVSFLIGRNGKIRYIHPGGEYHKELDSGHEKCVSDYYEFEGHILSALRESFD